MASSAFQAADDAGLRYRMIRHGPTGYERGTITPFGSLQSWPVIADARIAGREITLGAGEHGVAMAAAADDVIGVLDATTADISEPETT